MGEEGGAKQLEYCSRLCEKELIRSSSNVKCAKFDVMSRKIMLLDASVTCWVNDAPATSDATRDVASELQNLMVKHESLENGRRAKQCNIRKRGAQEVRRGLAKAPRK